MVLLVFPDGFARCPVHWYKLVTSSYFRSVGWQMLVHSMAHLLDERKQEKTGKCLWCRISGWYIQISQSKWETGLDLLLQIYFMYFGTLGLPQSWLVCLDEASEGVLEGPARPCPEPCTPREGDSAGSVQLWPVPPSWSCTSCWLFGVGLVCGDVLVSLKIEGRRGEARSSLNLLPYIPASSCYQYHPVCARLPFFPLHPLLWFLGC